MGIVEEVEADVQEEVVAGLWSVVRRPWSVASGGEKKWSSEEGIIIDTILFLI